MAEEARQGYDFAFGRDDGDSGYGRVLAVSLVLHVVALVLIPVLLQLFNKPKNINKPHTFELVAAPIPPQAQKSVPTPPPPEPPPPTPPPPTPPPPTPAPAPTPTPTPPPPKPPEPRPTPPQPRPTPPAPTPEKTVKRETEEDLAQLTAALSVLPPVEASAATSGVPNSYINQVVGKIRRNYTPATENRNIAIFVTFTIHKNGEASDISIAKSSGNSALDNEAMRAVQRASPFAPFPPSMKDDYIRLNSTIRPTRQR